MALSLAVASLLGAGLSAGGGLISNLINRKTAKENLAYQREANNQNIAFQKQENDITRQREDNAVTRASIDMQNAGLSKTLAAGNPASAQALSAPSMNALNNQFKYESALQKMNIASLMQDMAIKDNDIKMGWKRVENESKETDAKIENWGKQNAYYDSMTKLNDSLTELHNIEGDYKAKEIETDIDFKVQQIAQSKSAVSLNNQQILKLSYDMTESIARTNKLNNESELIVYDIVSKRLANLTNAYNFSKYMSVGMPVGYNPDGMFGLSNNIMWSDYKNPEWYSRELSDIFGAEYPETWWDKTKAWFKHYF